MKEITEIGHRRRSSASPPQAENTTSFLSTSSFLPGGRLASLAAKFSRRLT